MSVLPGSYKAENCLFFCRKMLKTGRMPCVRLNVSSPSIEWTEPILYICNPLTRPEQGQQGHTLLMVLPTFSRCAHTVASLAWRSGDRRCPEANGTHLSATSWKVPASKCQT